MMFGRKLEEPDPSMPLPTGRQASEPFDGIGWFEGRTLIPSDSIARDVRVMGVMALPSRARRNPAPSDVTPSMASLEERIEALEKQDE